MIKTFGMVPTPVKKSYNLGKLNYLREFQRISPKVFTGVISGLFSAVLSMISSQVYFSVLLPHEISSTVPPVISSRNYRAMSSRAYRGIFLYRFSRNFSQEITFSAAPMISPRVFLHLSWIVQEL